MITNPDGRAAARPMGGRREMDDTARIVRAVAAAPDGLTFADLHDALGGSLSRLRRELRSLCTAGAIVSSRDAPSGPGRPQLRYRIARRAGGSDEIVSLLIGLLGSAADLSEDQIVRFGADRGRALAAMVDDGDPVLDPMSRLGFAPHDISVAAERRRRERSLRFQHCPFAEAVLAGGADAVCALHYGLLAGAADAAGLAVASFEPHDPFSAGCRASLAPVIADSA